MGTDQDECGYQRQFNAAVSVIQGLPKNGSYRPSYEEMLLFYSYYKQATVGPCNITRPGFWDPIGRYKWDAWNKLGQMSKEDAMGAYIREMKKVAQKIIDTVPLEDKTPDMFEPFRPLYEVIPDMPRPPDSFFKTQTEEENFEGGNNHVLKEEEQYVSTLKQTDLVAHWGQRKEEERRDPVALPEPLMNDLSHQWPKLPNPGAGFPKRTKAAERTSQECGEGAASQLDAGDRRLGSRGSENDDFSDSLERLGSDENYEDDGSMINPDLFEASDSFQKKAKSKARRHNAERRKDPDSVTVSASLGHACSRYPGESKSSDMSSESQNTCRSSSHHLSPQIAATMESLQASVQGLCQRLEGLERVLQDQQQYISERTQRSPKEPNPQRSGIGQSQTLLFIVIWPFIVHWLLRRLYGRKS